MSDLPNWVYDVVIELQRWSYEHPKLYAQYAGSNEYQRVDKCGCEALQLVPEEVLAEAKVIRAYVDHSDNCSGCGPGKPESTDVGPWIHTCNLTNLGLTTERQARCKACAAEGERP